MTSYFTTYFFIKNERDMSITDINFSLLEDVMYRLKNDVQITLAFNAFTNNDVIMP